MNASRPMWRSRLLMSTGHQFTTAHGVDAAATPLTTPAAQPPPPKGDDMLSHIKGILTEKNPAFAVIEARSDKEQDHLAKIVLK